MIPRLMMVSWALCALPGCADASQDLIARPIEPGGYPVSAPSSTQAMTAADFEVGDPQPAEPTQAAPTQMIPPMDSIEVVEEPEPDGAEPVDEPVVDGAGLLLPKPDPEPDATNTDVAMTDTAMTNVAQPDPGDPGGSGGSPATMGPSAMSPPEPESSAPAASNPPDCPPALPGSGASCFSFSQCVYGTSTCQCMTTWQCTSADDPVAGPDDGAGASWDAAWTALAGNCTGFGCHNTGAGGVTINPADEAMTLSSVTPRKADVLRMVESGMMPPMGGLSIADRQAIVDWASSP